MSKEQEFFDKGYNDQCWGYPLLDHAWEGNSHPKEYQESYRKGQIKAYQDGKAECPWFYKPTDLDVFNRLLREVADSDAGIRRKITLLKKYLDEVYGKKGKDE